jgi:hypothetical protein
MAGLTTPVEDNILNWMKGTTWPSLGAWGAAPTTTYVGLFTTNPTSDAATSNGSTEVSVGSYARVAITSSSGWSSISGGSTTPAQISNADEVTFPTATANWGAVVGIGVFDAATNGNLLWWGSISSQTINTGVTAFFAPGALVLTCD